MCSNLILFLLCIKMHSAQFLLRPLIRSHSPHKTNRIRFCSIFICRCYDDALANKTIDQVREIYANYPNPHCAAYGSHVATQERDQHEATNEIEEHTCTKFIYNLDFGYHSMVSEVSHFHRITGPHSMLIQK